MAFITTGALILLAGAALALVLRANPLRAWASIATQALGTALVLFAAVPVLFGGGEIRHRVAWPHPVDSLTVHLDPLSAFFLTWSLPMTLLGTVYAVGYLRPFFQTRNAGVQFALLNVTSLSFVMIYTLENATVFLLGWEIAAVAAWLLVIWDYHNQKIRFAGFNYLVSTHIGFFFLVAAFMALHSRTGSMNFDGFSAALREPSAMRDAVFLLLVTSFGLKSAFFPFHTWLPRAHSAAPAHVSALMSGVIHKAGLFGLLRFTLLIGKPEPWMGWYLVGFSALSALMGVLYTTAQRDLKRMLGYSSTENVGIAGIGFGLGYLGLCWNQPALVALGFTGGMLHVLNHALFKCLLFYAAGAIYRATHLVDLERLGGLARRMPWTAAFFLLGGLAISALPPFNGFVSELILYSGLLSRDVPTGLSQLVLVSAAALLAFVGGVSALSIARAFGITFLGTPRDPSVHCQGDAAATMRLAMAAHAAGVIALGLVPAIGLRLVEAPAGQFLALIDAPSAAALPASQVIGPILVLSASFLGILGLLLAARWWLARGRPADVGVTWGCGYTSVNARMQYSGTSFSSPFASLFRSFLPQLRRERLPEDAFPPAGGHVNTHCVDAVERRMFEVLGEGEALASKLVTRLSERPQFAFALGLVALAAMAALALMETPS